MLKSKNIDIDRIRDSILETITKDTDNEELFFKLAYVTLQLRDGHSYLEEKDKTLSVYYEYSNFMRRLSTFNIQILRINYWRGLHKVELSEGNYIYYGNLSSHPNIGYIYINSFKAPLSDNLISKIFEAMKDTKALLIDIRNNGGGDPNSCSQIASYLTDKRFYTGFERFKVGPGRDDFFESKIYISPNNSKHTYLKPTYILTNRSSFSAATTLVYLTSPISHVKTVGDTTGGGSGFSTDGYLANGWHWSLSISEFIDTKERHLDEGIPPDIYQLLTKEQFEGNNPNDAIIERAISDFRSTYKTSQKSSD